MHLISYNSKKKSRSTHRLLNSDKNSLKNTIQNNTQTTIKYSKININEQTQRIVKINGTTHNDVYTARQQIKAISGNDSASQNRSQPTHFTCIKITDPTIKMNYSRFKVGSINFDQINFICLN